MDAMDERLVDLRLINLQDVLVVVHQLDCNLELVRLERLLEPLDDQLAAVSARLVQFFPIDEVPDDVEDVVECVNRGQLVAAKFKVGAGKELDPDIYEACARQLQLVAE